MQKTYQAAIYLRLSRKDGDVTEDSKQVSNSIANQKELVMDYLKSHPEIQIVDSYVDDGFSGVDFERPEFQRMLSDIRENKIKETYRKSLEVIFFIFFRLLPELSRQKALRKVEGRWMSGGHPFSADRIGKETCLR